MVVLQENCRLNSETLKKHTRVVFLGNLQTNNVKKAEQAAQTLKQLDPLNANYQEIFKSLKV